MSTDPLAQLDIFSRLTPEEVALLRLRMRRLRITAGSVIFKEGDEGNEMYVVLSGTVAISITTDSGEEMEVSRVEKGSFFGEMSILEEDVRSATCRAVDACVLMCLGADGFRSLVDMEPAVAFKILQHMLHTAADRLQATGSFYSDMVKWGEGARRRAVTDDLTGLYNRRFFDEAYNNVFNDFGAPAVSLAILDLDHFGELNAKHGEQAGDRVLIEVASLFAGTFGETDILARYGGDEFAVILPNRDGPEALERCRRVGELIRESDFGLPQSAGRVTTSIGVAVLHQDGKKPDALWDRADRALYAAKEAGRDCAVLEGADSP